ncbi:MAG: pyrroline-5-carboxylate reductase [Lutispora sp.]|nr:pyrroline-5-carboxylate reductase [Lutispora sp.]
MNKNIGFIGSGNMAGAMIDGLLNSGIIAKDNIMASNTTREKLDKLKARYDIQTTLNNKEVAEFADILVLSVKPNKFGAVIKEISENVKNEVVIVSIAAGISIDTILRLFQKNLKIVRTMPNIPAVVGEAITGLCYNNLVNNGELEDVLMIFNSFGKVEVLDEELMDVVTAVSASSPALVYMFIEALADGAVLKGLPRDKAYKMVSQAVLGAAKMVLETGCHPGQLKDRVCSSGGTAIEAIFTLEKKGFRGNVIESIDRCTEKATKLGKTLNSRFNEEK